MITVSLDTEIPQDSSYFLALRPKFTIEPNLQNIIAPYLLPETDLIINKLHATNKTLILAKSCNLKANCFHN